VHGSGRWGAGHDKDVYTQVNTTVWKIRTKEPISTIWVGAAIFAVFALGLESIILMCVDADIVNLRFAVIKSKIHNA
jgi:hypothetical protein